MKNCRNGSFYRFVRLEGQRVRIRPLELFPNGLLIEKTADTIVEADLEVDLVGSWTDELYVENPKADRARRVYSTELETKRGELVVLEAEYLVIDPKDKGSHANKVKAVAGRIVALERGLAEPEHKITKVSHLTKKAQVFAARTLVQLPSGNPAMVIGPLAVKGSTVPYARIRTRIATGLVESAVPQEVLRPWGDRRMATI